MNIHNKNYFIFVLYVNFTTIYSKMKTKKKINKKLIIVKGLTNI